MNRRNTLSGHRPCFEMKEAAQLPSAGLIGGSAYFIARHKQLADLAARYAVPAIFETREFAAEGGLMSYGGGITDAYRLLASILPVYSRATRPAGPAGH